MGKKKEKYEEIIENGEDPEEVLSKPSKKVKRAFTIRLDEDLLNQLERLGKNTSKAMIARSFLDLRRYIILKPNQHNPITAVDGTPFALLPINLWGSILHVLPSAKQLEIGDELGKIININCGLDDNVQSQLDKMSYLQGLGIFECTEVTGKFRGEKRSFLGIKAKVWPLDVMHALLYRLLHNHQIPEEWMDIGSNVAEHIEDSEKSIFISPYGENCSP